MILHFGKVTFIDGSGYSDTFLTSILFLSINSE